MASGMVRPISIACLAGTSLIPKTTSSSGAPVAVCSRGQLHTQS